MKVLKRTWADISLDNLEHNYKTLREHVGKGPRFLGVVKADSYGHGAVQVSRTLEELGAEYLAVSNLEEAIQLRRGGVGLPVLILGYTPPEYAPDEAEMSITQEVHGLQYAKDLNKALEGTGRKLTVHLKIDTGMTRLGFFADQPEQTLAALVEVAQLPNLYIEGIFMHFCVSDSKKPEDVAFTKLQHERFVNMLDLMKSKGIEPEIRHCCNSGATILRPEYAMDMIRPGVATYGFHPSPDTVGEIDLRPMMSLHTSIAQIRTIAAGKSISYGRTYETAEPTRMAVISMGYADGYLRTGSGKAHVILDGKRAPVIGRICMDMCMVRIPEGANVHRGDEVTVFGPDGWTAEDAAEAAGTISYEVLCAVSRRVPRYYIG